MEEDLKPLLTPEQAAELLHVSVQTIRGMIERKELPAYKVGSDWRLRASELSKQIQAREKL